MKYLLVLLTIPFLFGFCQVGQLCPIVPGYDNVYQPQGQQQESFSNTSQLNPFATNPPKIYSEDGKYLGQLSANPYLPDSTSNPFGRYGNKFSSDSINNPYSNFDGIGY